MKVKNILLTPLLLLAVAITAASCNEVEKNYPLEISFTEYSLEGTSCQWIKLNKERCNYSELIVINSNEELGSYITCSVGGSYPEIDFSQHTLLLAHGVRCYQDILNHVSLQQASKQNYVVRVGFQKSLAAALREWRVAIIIDKLLEESSVELENGNVIF